MRLLVSNVAARSSARREPLQLVRVKPNKGAHHVGDKVAVGAATGESEREEFHLPPVTVIFLRPQEASHDILYKRSALGLV